MCNAKNNEILIGSDLEHLRTIANTENVAATKIALRVVKHAETFGVDEVSKILASSNWESINEEAGSLDGIGVKSDRTYPYASLKAYKGRATRAIIISGREVEIRYRNRYGNWYRPTERYKATFEIGAAESLRSEKADVRSEVFSLDKPANSSPHGVFERLFGDGPSTTDNSPTSPNPSEPTRASLAEVLEFALRNGNFPLIIDKVSENRVLVEGEDFKLSYCLS